ncbi:MAG: HXXEE domain-containing protein [Balneolaceae bacterium]|nr:HXXEE domain-containing protein [Balneolaceae bacterium]
MQVLRNHWFDLGCILAVVALGHLYVNFNEFTYYRIVLYINLISLFLHHFEEYRIIGTYPEMINKVLFKSELPDRFPLNPQIALLTNVGIGWVSYLGAVIFAESAVWLGIAAIIISFGNFITHTFLFNIKARSIFNAGMITGILQFLPVSAVFFWIVIDQNLGSSLDYLIGIPLGVLLFYTGELKMIDWLKDRDTDYIFPERNLY